jgi:hypothetical protein
LPFKHALIQDAAYENLLKSRRQVLHRRVGEVPRDQFAASAAAEPELLAHHFTQADLTDAAIEWWGKAGHRSLERSALIEAIAQLTRALDQITNVAATPPLRQRRCRWWHFCRNGVATVVTPLPVQSGGERVGDEATDGSRLLIGVGACGPFVAHAEIVLAHGNRKSPKSAKLPFLQCSHSLGRCRHAGLPLSKGRCTQTVPKA